MLYKSANKTMLFGCVQQIDDGLMYEKVISSPALGGLVARMLNCRGDSCPLEGCIWNIRMIEYYHLPANAFYKRAIEGIRPEDCSDHFCSRDFVGEEWRRSTFMLAAIARVCEQHVVVFLRLR